jgi:predicted class III extradiol MEMO1 family dioxygenase
MAVRHPAVAGAFYDAKPISLRQQIIGSFMHTLGPGRLPEGEGNAGILAIVVPHAGFIYSGASAAHAYLSIAEQGKPDTVIVIGPNHTGQGTPISVMGEGYWETPLGLVPLDTDLAGRIVKNSGIAEFDDAAVAREHSVEVQLPFLQFIYPEFKLVPICMGYHIASTDLNHMEPKAESNRKDKYVLDAIEAMDEAMLQESVRRERISTCGYGPVSATLVASKLGGAKSAEILSYYTSGDIIGDNRQVVGYASAKITRNEI